MMSTYSDVVNEIFKIQNIYVINEPLRYYVIAFLSQYSQILNKLKM